MQELNNEYFDTGVQPKQIDFMYINILIDEELGRI